MRPKAFGGGSLHLAALVAVVVVAASMGACVDGETEKGPKSGECATCHLAEYEGVTHPMHPGKKPKTCATCHKSTSWSPAILKHEWPLTGKHKKTDCFACHTGKPAVFEGTPGECVDCHLDDFVHVKFPEHAKFAKTCDDCHTTDGWKDTKEGAPKKPKKTPEPEPTARPEPTTPPVADPKPTARPMPTDLVPKPKPKPTVNPPQWPPDPPDTSSGASPRH
jgi:hypothetical protein